MRVNSLWVLLENVFGPCWQEQLRRAVCTVDIPELDIDHPRSAPLPKSLEHNIRRVCDIPEWMICDPVEKGDPVQAYVFHVWYPRFFARLGYDHDAGCVLATANGNGLVDPIWIDNKPSNKTQCEQLYSRALSAAEINDVEILEDFIDGLREFRE